MNAVIVQLLDAIPGVTGLEVDPAVDGVSASNQREGSLSTTPHCMFWSGSKPLPSLGSTSTIADCGAKINPVHASDYCQASILTKNPTFRTRAPSRRARDLESFGISDEQDRVDACGQTWSKAPHVI